MSEIKVITDKETIVIDIGESVICDICNKDYTNSDKPGGFLFQSKGVCPECAPEIMELIKKYNDQEYIRGHCPPGMAFKDWILEMRKLIEQRRIGGDT